MRKIKDIQVKWVYIEPKTPEEKAEQQGRINHAYDILFNETLKYLAEKKKRVQDNK